MNSNDPCLHNPFVYSKNRLTERQATPGRDGTYIVFMEIISIQYNQLSSKSVLSTGFFFTMNRLITPVHMITFVKDRSSNLMLLMISDVIQMRDLFVIITLGFYVTKRVLLILSK